MSEQNRPTIGLAFSGASTRSVFYIGFLEVLHENRFPIDYIAAMSGGAIVAASYACGTLPQLKRQALSLNKEFLFSLIERSKGNAGIYNLHKIEEMLRVYTRNLPFEDVKPCLGFVATDITNGEEVVLQMGDIAHAVCTSCALPGVFEPVHWGNRTLIDGGIVNVIPGNVAQAAGMDVVIGIDMRATRHIFSPWQISLKRFFNFMKNIVWPSHARQLVKKVREYFEYIDSFDATLERPGMFSVLGRALDLAIEAQKKYDPATSTYHCDLLIVPETPVIPAWKRYLYLHFTDFSNTQALYESGRKTAEEYLPKMWQLVADRQHRQQKNAEKIKALL